MLSWPSVFPMSWKICLHSSLAGGYNSKNIKLNSLVPSSVHLLANLLYIKKISCQHTVQDVEDQLQSFGRGVLQQQAANWVLFFTIAQCDKPDPFVFLKYWLSSKPWSWNYCCRTLLSCVYLRRKQSIVFWLTNPWAHVVLWHCNDWHFLLVQPCFTPLSPCGSINVCYFILFWTMFIYLFYSFDICQSRLS